MQRTVTKSEVIQAIMTEPLAGGYYVHTFSTSSKHSFRAGSYRNNTGCAVCAVGGILDTAFGKTTNSEGLAALASSMVKLATFEYLDGAPKENRANVVKEAKKLIRKGYHLSALSMVFEHLFKVKGMRTTRGLASLKLRKTLVRFVNKNFPNKLVLNTEETY